jgi:hypothetical protein
MKRIIPVCALCILLIVVGFRSGAAVQEKKNAIGDVGLVKRVELLEKLVEQQSKVNAITAPPVGTIMPFFGAPSQLTGTCWTLCDGRTVPADSEVDKLVDANPSLAGVQVPDLRGRFLKSLGEGTDDGFEALLAEKAIRVGGRTHFPEHRHPHSHIWSIFEAENWYSYVENKTQIRITQYPAGSNGGSAFAGNNKDFYLYKKKNENVTLYTAESNESPYPKQDIQPPFACVYFIIKARSR